MKEEDVEQYILALKKLKNGKKELNLPSTESSKLNQLGTLIKEVRDKYNRRLTEFNRLFRITEELNEEIELDEVWNNVYESFQHIIPFDRIGVAELKEAEEGQIVRSTWSRSESDTVKIQAGYSAPLEGSSLENIIETEEPRIINDLQKYLKEKPYSESTRLIVEEGIRSSLTCPLYALGKPIGFVFFSSRELGTYKDKHIGIFKQISNHLSMVVEKSRMMQELRELDDLKNEILRIAAHDMKSPANVIRNYVQIWKQGYYGEVTDKQKEPLERIESTCYRMLDLIDNLMNLSDIESGEMTLEKEQVNVKEILTNFYLDSSSLAEEKSIDVKLDIPEKLPELKIDKNKIIQVIDNYFSNAVKYSKPETEITIGASMSEDSVEIYVQDQGQGIPKDKQHKLFTKFGKAGVKPTGKEKSTGLGLYISKIFIEKHGGAVGAESEHGKGSRFYFSLPK